MLTGEYNPSGRTTDIWPADFTADPTFGNFGGKHYTDVSGFYEKNYNNVASEGTAYFVEYKEGVYMGYRYYETAAAEAEAGNYAGFDYDSAVVFPFGYGLSYTTFTQTLDSVDASGDKVTVTATVTNSGSVEGKDVVEVYYSAPYTKGGIEKPAVVLAGFAKTSALAAGASETVKVEFPVRQMASWSSEKGAYVLDGGDYVVSLRTDSHTVVDQQTVSVTEKTFDTDEVTGTKLQNQFADLTEYMEKNCKGEMLSRSDFKGTFPKPAEDKDSADCGITVAEYNWKDHEDSAATMPTTGASNGLSLIDMRGKDYDDEAWDTLLDQLSVDEMTGMLNDCAYNTGAVESISKPETSEPDGPAGFTSLTGPTGNCAYCSEFIMAQTWNVELMERMGEMVGQEALASGHAILLVGKGGIHGHLILGGIPVGQAQIVVLGLQIHKGQDELLLDDLPEHTGHLIAIHLHQRRGHLDLFHNSFPFLCFKKYCDPRRHCQMLCREVRLYRYAAASFSSARSGQSAVLSTGQQL